MKPVILMSELKARLRISKASRVQKDLSPDRKGKARPHMAHTRAAVGGRPETPLPSCGGGEGGREGRGEEGGREGSGGRADATSPRAYRARHFPSCATSPRVQAPLPLVRIGPADVQKTPAYSTRRRADGTAYSNLPKQRAEGTRLFNVARAAAPLCRSHRREQKEEETRNACRCARARARAGAGASSPRPCVCVCVCVITTLARASAGQS